MSFELDPAPVSQPPGGTSIVVGEDASSPARLVQAALADPNAADLIWLVGAREKVAVSRAITALHKATSLTWSPQVATESSFRMVSHRTSATVRLLAGRRSPLRRGRRAHNLARRGHEIGADLQHLVELRDEVTLAQQRVAVAEHELAGAVGDLEAVTTALQDAGRSRCGSAVQSRLETLGVSLVIAYGALGGADVRLGQLRFLAATIETSLAATARLAAAVDLAIARRVKREPSRRLTEIDPIVTKAVEQVRADAGGGEETIETIDVLRLLGPVPSSLDGRWL